MMRRSVGRLIQLIFKRFGYYRIDYGFACGRHWMSIDGKVIAQTSGDDVYLPDEDVRRLVISTIGAPEWKGEEVGR